MIEQGTTRIRAICGGYGKPKRPEKILFTAD